jgi:hypothetical protein
MFDDIIYGVDNKDIDIDELLQRMFKMFQSNGDFSSFEEMIEDIAENNEMERIKKMRHKIDEDLRKQGF